MDGRAASHAIPLFKCTKYAQITRTSTNRTISSRIPDVVPFFQCYLSCCSTILTPHHTTPFHTLHSNATGIIFINHSTSSLCHNKEKRKGMLPPVHADNYSSARGLKTENSFPGESNKNRELLKQKPQTRPGRQTGNPGSSAHGASTLIERSVGRTQSHRPPGTKPLTGAMNPRWPI